MMSQHDPRNHSSEEWRSKQSKHQSDSTSKLLDMLLALKLLLLLKSRLDLMHLGLRFHNVGAGLCGHLCVLGLDILDFA